MHYTARMASKHSALMRIIIFGSGMPGYLLVLFPWLYVATVALLKIAQFSSSGNITFSELELQAKSVYTVPQAILILVLSSGLWIFLAWVTKHAMLWLAKKFDATEKSWQIMKALILIMGWIALCVTANALNGGISTRFITNSLLFAFVGVLSFGLEFILTRTLLHKK